MARDYSENPDDDFPTANYKQYRREDKQAWEDHKQRRDAHPNDASPGQSYGPGYRANEEASHRIYKEENKRLWSEHNKRYQDWKLGGFHRP